MRIGQRQVLAAREAGLTTIPAYIVENEYSNVERLLEQFTAVATKHEVTRPGAEQGVPAASRVTRAPAIVGSVFRKLRRRRGRVDVGRYEAPPPVDPVPVAEIAEEGVLIAASAVRMTVKNRQIVRALRDRADYSEKAAISAAREVFRALAREKRDEVDRLEDILDRTRDRPGRALHQTDYREGDAELLGRREQVSGLLAERLDELSADDEYLRGIVVAARDAAWDEIGASILAKLARRPEAEARTAEYDAERAHRIRELIAVDLPLLEASRRPEY